MLSSSFSPFYCFTFWAGVALQIKDMGLFVVLSYTLERTMKFTNWTANTPCDSL